MTEDKLNKIVELKKKMDKCNQLLKHLESDYFDSIVLEGDKRFLGSFTIGKCAVNDFPEFREFLIDYFRKKTKELQEQFDAIP